MQDNEIRELLELVEAAEQEYQDRLYQEEWQAIVAEMAKHHSGIIS